MNVEALKKVVGHITFIGCQPTNIAFDINVNLNGVGDAGSAVQTFTRFQWQCVGEGTPQKIDSAASIENNFLFMINTVAQIAIQPETGPIPESENIPESALLCKMNVTFAVMYASDVERDTLDVEGMQEFVLHNTPYHFWPYWRELIQSLAMRGQMPVPVLPPYRVPDAAQACSVPQEK